MEELAQKKKRVGCKLQAAAPAPQAPNVPPVDPGGSPGHQLEWGFIKLERKGGSPGHQLERGLMKLERGFRKEGFHKVRKKIGGLQESVRGVSGTDTFIFLTLPKRVYY